MKRYILILISTLLLSSEVYAGEIVDLTPTAGGGGTGESLVQDITEIDHGFTIGDVVSQTTSGWVKAQADSEDTLAAGIVTVTEGSDGFTVTTHGLATDTSHGLTIGEYYWLDQDTAGAVAGTQPTSGIVQQVLQVRDADTYLVDIKQALDLEAPVFSVVSSSSYNQTVINEAIACYSANNDVTINLLTAAGFGGRGPSIKKMDSPNKCFVDAYSIETVEGFDIYSGLDVIGETILLMSDNSNFGIWGGY